MLGIAFGRRMGFPSQAGRDAMFADRLQQETISIHVFRQDFSKKKWNVFIGGFCGTGKLLRREAFFRRMQCWSGGGGTSVLTLRMRLEIACP